MPEGNFNGSLLAEDDLGGIFEVVCRASCAFPLDPLAVFVSPDSDIEVEYRSWFSTDSCGFERDCPLPGPVSIGLEDLEGGCLDEFVHGLSWRATVCRALDFAVWEAVQDKDLGGFFR